MTQRNTNLELANGTAEPKQVYTQHGYQNQENHGYAPSQCNNDKVCQCEANWCLCTTPPEGNDRSFRNYIKTHDSYLKLMTLPDII